MNIPRAISPMVVAFCVVGLAACGGSNAATTNASDAATTTTAATTVSESSVPATTAPPTTQSATTAPSTTAPSTAPATTAPATTVPATTVPEAEPFGLAWLNEGEWYQVNRVTADDGVYFVDLDTYDLVRASEYVLDCGDDACKGFLRKPGNDESHIDVAVAFDGTSLTISATTMEPCLNKQGGNYDGPSTTAYTTVVTLTPVYADDGGFSHLAGNMASALSTLDSEQCVAETGSAMADTIVFSPQRARQIAPPADTYLGDSGTTLLTERRIAECASGCVAEMTTPFTEVSDGSSVLVTTSLTMSADVLGGTGSFVSSCVSDIDGSFISADGYDVTVEAEVRAFDVGVPVLLLNEHLVGTTRADLPAEQAAVCAPYEQRAIFVGLPTDRPTLLTAG